MTASQQGDAARKAAIIRTAGETGVSTLATIGGTAAVMAAAGSVIPVGGTAVGFVVGAAVGGIMLIPTGDGKNVGDRIGDASQWTARELDDAGHKVGSFLSGLFH